MNTFTLSKPLKTHDGEVTTLTLSEPTAASFIRHAEPFKIKWLRDQEDKPTLDITYDNKAMASFLADMITPRIDDLLIGKIGAVDFVRLRNIATDILLGVIGAEASPS